MADILSESKSKDLNEFKKDFIGLIETIAKINEEYCKVGKQIDKYTIKFKEIINLFNKKYKNLIIKLNKTIEELKIIILIKEKSVRDIFNIASKIDGLKAIGITESGMASIEDANKFSKELDRVTDKLFISYAQSEGPITISLEQYKKGMIKFYYDEDIINEKSPAFKLCSYYAVKGGVNDVDVIEELNSFGFLEFPSKNKIKKFIEKFNPPFGE